MSQMESYLKSLKGKRIAVIGIGVSNTPLIRLLCKAGLSVTACDKNSRETLGGVAEELEQLGAELCLGDDYLDHLHHDVIFRTPGLRPDAPQLLEAKRRGSVITSEMEIFFQVCPCKKIAVTGSDGKTTTTTIIAGLLSAAGYRVHVGGNIGKPLLPEVETILPDDIAVLELSSFQLMTMDISPEIAVMTNLAPNHLDVHKSMEEYCAAKENIFLHQTPQDRAVFNADNAITRALSKKAVGKAVLFSRLTPLEEGIFVQDGAIWSASSGAKRKVLAIEEILLPGVHNVENYMAAIAAVDGIVPDAVIQQYARTFGGVEHRIELVRTLNGVRYYNDSIASSPSRTIAGLRSFEQKVILIAGGYDKQIPFDVLGPEIVKHVKLLSLSGKTAEKIQKSVEQAPEYTQGSPEIVRCGNFKEAVLAAHRAAQPGDVVLMSPACASFDQFKNFAARGEAFKEIVRSL